MFLNLNKNNEEKFESSMNIGSNSKLTKAEKMKQASLSERRNNKIRNTNRFIASYLNEKNKGFKEITYALFDDLKNQYINKLNYLTNQDTLINKQNNILLKKKYSVNKNENSKDKTTINLDVQKHKINKSQHNDDNLEKILHILKLILFICSIIVIIFIIKK